MSILEKFREEDSILEQYRSQERYQDPLDKYKPQREGVFAPAYELEYRKPYDDFVTVYGQQVPPGPDFIIWYDGLTDTQKRQLSADAYYAKIENRNERAGKIGQIYAFGQEMFQGLPALVTKVIPQTLGHAGERMFSPGRALPAVSAAIHGEPKTRKELEKERQEKYPYSILVPETLGAVTQEIISILPTFIDEPLLAQLEKTGYFGEMEAKTWAQKWEEEPGMFLLDMAIVADLLLKLPTLGAKVIGRGGAKALSIMNVRNAARITRSSADALAYFEHLAKNKGYTLEKAATEINSRTWRGTQEAVGFADDVISKPKPTTAPTPLEKVVKTTGEFAERKREPIKFEVLSKQREKVPLQIERQYSANVFNRTLQWGFAKAREKVPVIERALAGTERRLGFEPWQRYIDVFLKTIQAKAGHAAAKEFRAFRKIWKQVPPAERLELVRAIQKLHVNPATGYIYFEEYGVELAKATAKCYDAYGQLISKLNEAQKAVGLDLTWTLAEYSEHAKSLWEAEGGKLEELYELGKTEAGKAEIKRNRGRAYMIDQSLYPPPDPAEAALWYLLKGKRPPVGTEAEAIWYGLKWKRPPPPKAPPGKPIPEAARPPEPPPEILSELGLKEPKLTKPAKPIPGKAAKPVAKEPWEMTQAEYLESQKGKFYKGSIVAEKEIHEVKVSRALRRGKPVPPEVLAEYPELAGKAVSRAQEYYNQRLKTNKEIGRAYGDDTRATEIAEAETAKKFGKDWRTKPTPKPTTFSSKKTDIAAEIERLGGEIPAKATKKTLWNALKKLRKEQKGGIDPRVFPRNRKQQAEAVKVKLQIKAPMYYPHLFPEKRGGLATGIYKSSDTNHLPAKIGEFPRAKFRVGYEGWSWDLEEVSQFITQQTQAYVQDKMIIDRLMKSVVRDTAGKPVIIKSIEEIPDGYMPFYPSGRLRIYKAQIDFAETIRRVGREGGEAFEAIYKAFTKLFPDGLKTREILGITDNPIYIIPKKIGERVSAHLRPRVSFGVTYRNYLNLWKEGTLAGLFYGRWQVNNFVGNILMSIMDGSVIYVPEAIKWRFNKWLQELIPPETTSGGFYSSMRKPRPFWKNVEKTDLSGRFLRGAGKTRVGITDAFFAGQEIVDEVIRTAAWLKRMKPYINKAIKKGGYKRNSSMFADNMFGLSVDDLASVLREIQTADPMLAEKLTGKIAQNIYDFSIKTPFEKWLSAHTHPFISWYKFTHAWTLGMAINAPYKIGFLVNMSKITRDIRETEANILLKDTPYTFDDLPQWMRELDIVGYDPETRMIRTQRMSGANPLQDLFNLKYFVTGGAPPLKWGLETSQEYNPFTERKLVGEQAGFGGKVPESEIPAHMQNLLLNRLSSLFTEVMPYGNFLQYGMELMRPYQEYPTKHMFYPQPYLDSKTGEIKYPHGTSGWDKFWRLFGITIREIPKRTYIKKARQERLRERSAAKKRRRKEYAESR